MGKLKTVIKEYGRWSALSTYVERIETHIEIDFSHSLEQACMNEYKVFTEEMDSG